MVTAFVATVLILGIAIYQAVHGLYSALIMAVLTTLSALTALAFYELARNYERVLEISSPVKDNSQPSSSTTVERSAAPDRGGTPDS